MKTKVTHTPGPWEVVAHQENGVVVAVRDGGMVRTVALCADSSTWIPDDQARINASLIAAAPELLAKLEELYEWLDGIGDGAPDASPTSRKALNQSGEIDALIRKAKGESQ